MFALNIVQQNAVQVITSATSTSSSAEKNLSIIKNPISTVKIELFSLTVAAECYLIGFYYLENLGSVALKCTFANSCVLSSCTHWRCFQIV